MLSVTVSSSSRSVGRSGSSRRSSALYGSRAFFAANGFPAPHHGQRFRTKAWAMARDWTAVTVSVRDRLTAISWSVMRSAVPPIQLWDAPVTNYARREFRI
jgi:hypothetical protein